MKKLFFAVVLTFGLGLGVLHANQAKEVLDLHLAMSEYDDDGIAGEGPRYGSFDKLEYDKKKRLSKNANRANKTGETNAQFAALEEAFRNSVTMEDAYYEHTDT